MANNGEATPPWGGAFIRRLPFTLLYGPGLQPLSYQASYALIPDPVFNETHQPVLVECVEGKHDTLPIPKTFRTPLPSLENVIRLKAKGCKRYGKLTEKVGHTCSLSSPMKVDR